MPTTEEMDTLKMKRAWEVAIAPAKQLPMRAIGMYMSGNSLQIFAIMNVQGQFARFESEGNASKLLGTKLVFIVTNLLSVALGLWKVNGMGLLPYVDRHWLTRDILTIRIEQPRVTGLLGRRLQSHYTGHNFYAHRLDHECIPLRIT